MTALLAFDDLTLGYDRHPAVHHLSGEIATGSLTAIVGPNGAGKSTLLKGIVGMLRPIGGRIRLHGLERRAVAHLPQAAEIDRSFPISVFDFVALGGWARIGLFGGIVLGVFNFILVDSASGWMKSLSACSKCAAWGKKAWSASARRGPSTAACATCCSFCSPTASPRPMPCASTAPMEATR